MEAGKQERSSRRRSLVIAGDGPLAPPKQRAQKGLLLLQLPWLVKVARKRRKNQKIWGSRATKRVGFCVKRIAPKNRFFLLYARLYYQARPLCKNDLIASKNKNRFFLFSARIYYQVISLRGVFFGAQLLPVINVNQHIEVFP